ncbi:hypothetical protein [uncultured Cellulomonas sp.]|uniref:hypothetical protein n=1 Tax=uncultured Cellulomonas sp. TaxID=189682 RepID=UPI0028E6741F|nr:hypothetical protein [uncultured Cellulomonas sp.]
MTEPVDFVPWDALGYPGSTLETTPAASRRSTIEVVAPQGRAARVAPGAQRRTDEVTSAGTPWVLARDWRGAIAVRDGVTGQTVAEVGRAGWGSRRSGVVDGRAVRWESAGLMTTRFRWVDPAGAVLLEVQPRGFLRRHLDLTVGTERLPGPTVLLLAALSRHLVADADEAASAGGS